MKVVAANKLSVLLVFRSALASDVNGSSSH